MKQVFLALALLLAVIVTPAQSKKQQAPPEPSFETQLQQATFALYIREPNTAYPTNDEFLDKEDVSNPEPWIYHFACTATVVAQADEGEYYLLTAGHCIDPDSEEHNKRYFVAEAVSDQPVLQAVHVAKYANTKKYDYALLRLETPKTYPVISVSVDPLPPIGTPIINENFSLGLTRQLATGYVASGIMKRGEPTKGCEDVCEGRFVSSIGVGPGASGSPVVDANTHKIIGLVEAITGYQIGTLVEPTGPTLEDFTIDASVDHTKPPKQIKKMHAPKPGIGAQLFAGGMCVVGGAALLWLILALVDAYAFFKQSLRAVLSFVSNAVSVACTTLRVLGGMVIAVPRTVKSLRQKQS